MDMLSWKICLLCLLAANGVWIVVFKSPLVKHLLSYISKDELFTNADVENYFTIRGMWFAQNLWVCSTCQSVWSAGLASVFYAAFRGDALLLPVYFLVLLPLVKWSQKHL
jgi:uncharacterized membrane protein